MALRGVDPGVDRLSCPICLDLLKDPATIPCGHSYCMSCIQSYWDEERPSCPQCRQDFDPRPVLVKNTLLSDLAEELRCKSQPLTPPAAAAADPCEDGAEDVYCDFCTDHKLKAVKSCLQCLVSYCDKHLQPHYDVPVLKKHKLVEASKNLQENVCSRHNEVMKMFCRTDQQCICYLCSVDEHKDHDTVSVATEMSLKQKEIGARRQNIQKRIQDKEKNVKVLHQQAELINHSADKALSDCEKILTEMKQTIRSRQKTEASRVQELQRKLEEEIAALRKKDKQLQQLSRTDDHIQFLSSFPSASRLGGPADSETVGPIRFSEEVTAAMSKAKDEVQDILSEEWNRMALNRAELRVLEAEPETREELVKYWQKITPDYNTAHKWVRQYYSYEQISFQWTRDALNTHPDAFIDWCQILCVEYLTGRCYWEVQWSGNIFVAVAYKSISRKGDRSVFGNNKESWALQCSKYGYEFRHNTVRSPISAPQTFQKIGVYVDHGAGVLCFYGVSDTMTLLHRVQTTFTEPLCPGFGVYSGSVSMCTPEGEKIY